MTTKINGNSDLTGTTNRLLGPTSSASLKQSWLKGDQRLLGFPCSISLTHQESLSSFERLILGNKRQLRSNGTNEKVDSSEPIIKRKFPSSALLSLENKQLFQGSSLQTKFPLTSSLLPQSFAQQHSVAQENIPELPVLTCHLQEPVSATLPDYQLETLHIQEPEIKHFPSLPEDARKKIFQQQNDAKVLLLTTVSTSLVCTPNFKHAEDLMRMKILQQAEQISEFDPEFILKVALYTRQVLNIRVTANFLLAYAAFDSRIRPYLLKYFCAAIVTPGDWIDVAEQYQVFDDSRLHFGSLPAMLRKAMKQKFAQFDQYQLAKYNKQKPPKKRNKEGKDEEEIVRPLGEADCPDLARLFGKTEEEIQLEKDLERRTFNLKRLVRTLHISGPAEYTMSLLGKKYPSDPESFRRSGLPGNWEADRAGQRLKFLPVETWETLTAIHGNQPKVWEQLIDNRKLPYMAMLRNLRNLLLVGISEEHHKKVITYLSKEKAVVKSRQFPFRFFTAFRILSELEQLLDREPKEIHAKTLAAKPWIQKQQRKIEKRLKHLDPKLVSQYKAGLESAIDIATVHNVDPIPGNTLVICDALSCYDDHCSVLKGVGKGINKAHHCAVLLTVMCCRACEKCEARVINSSDSWIILNPMEKSILKATETAVNDIQWDIPLTYEKSKVLYKGPFQHMMSYYWSSAVTQHKVFDNVLLLTSGSNGQSAMLDFSRKYRRLVNPNLIHVTVDLTGRLDQAVDIESPLHKNDAFLAGFSDQVLKFVAEKGSGMQLATVEAIDKTFSLKSKPKYEPDQIDRFQLNSSLSQETEHIPKWRTVKIFISSTFKDMHGERDLLVRHVFPELKVRARSLFVKIHEVDLRWGITETEACKSSTLLSCCQEVVQCDLFVGILGERYGFIPDISQLPNDPEFDWIREYRRRASITELEMYLGALCDPNRLKDRAFFYIRDNSFEKDVPKLWQGEFLVEDEESREMMSKLKEEIKTTGFEVFDRYPCWWGTVFNNQPMVIGLEQFGQRVLDNLWNAIQKLCLTENKSIDEEQEDDILHQTHIAKHQQVIGRNTVVNECLRAIAEEDGIFVITGRSGCGKTSILAELSKRVKGYHSILHFVGATPSSFYLWNLLFRLAHSMQRLSPRPIDVSKDVKSLAGQMLLLFQQTEIKLLIIVDGIDQLKEPLLQITNWIPHTLPSNVKMVISVTQDSIPYQSLVQRAGTKEAIKIFDVQPLEMPDRRKLVQLQLEPHRKALNESAFSNQMLMLITKRDAGHPLYLTLACTQLRMYGVFEELMTLLRSLPHNVPTLVQEMLRCMEQEYSKRIVRTAVCLIALTLEGLGECELYQLLSAQILLRGECSLADTLHGLVSLQPHDLMVPLHFNQLVQSLYEFLHPNEHIRTCRLTLTHPDIAVAVQSCYFTSAGRKEVLKLHRLLAASFLASADPQRNRTWKGVIPQTFQSLLHHLVLGMCYPELSEILCDLKFIEAAFRMGAEQHLLKAYTSVLDDLENQPLSSRMFLREEKKPTDQKRKRDDVEQYHHFILKNLHVLQKHPGMLLQLCVCEQESSSIWNDAKNSEDSLLFDWPTKPSTSNLEFQRIQDFTEAVLCVAVSPDSQLAAVGGKDGVLRIVNIRSGQLVHNLIGHSNSICGLCFVGHHQVCSASVDCTLSLWNIEKGIRVGVLSGHSRRVTSCCIDPHSNSIISVSWDCTIRVWSSKDLREISQIKHNKQPLTCIAHHPHRSVIVTGGWNRVLQLWDMQTLTRKAVMRGHSSSVKSVAFNSDGNMIVSASLTGEVFLWSSSQGVKMGQVGKQSRAVTWVSFLSSDQVIGTASVDGTLQLWTSSHSLLTSYSALLQNSRSCIPKVTSLTFLNKDHLAIGCQSGVLAVLEITSDKVRGQYQLGQHPISCMTPLTTSNGIIVGTTSGTIMSVKLWKCRDKGLVLKHLWPYCHADGITCCSFRNDILATGSQDASVRLWSTNSSTAQRILTGLQAGVNCVDLMEKVVIAGSSDGSIAVWNYMGVVLCILPPLKLSFQFICYSFQLERSASTPRRMMAIADMEGNISIKEPFKYQKWLASHGHQVSVTGACPIADGRILTSSLDRTLRLWTYPADHNLANQNASQKLHKARVSALDISLTRSLVASGDSMGTLVVWRLDSVDGKFYLIPQAVQKQEQASWTSVKFVHIEGARLVGAICQENEQADGIKNLLVLLRVVNATESLELQVIEEIDLPAEVTSMDYSFSSDCLVIGLKNDTIMISNSKCAHLAKLARTDSCPLIVKVLDGTQLHLVAALAIGTLAIFDNLSPNEEWTKKVRQGRNMPIDEVEIPSVSAKDGDRQPWPTALLVIDDEGIYIGDDDGRLVIWKDETPQTFQVHVAAVTNLYIHGNFLFTASLDQMVKVWNVDTMEQVGQFIFNSPVSALTVKCGSVSTLLVCGTSNGSMHLLQWNHFPRGSKME